MYNHHVAFIEKQALYIDNYSVLNVYILNR